MAELLTETEAHVLTAARQVLDDVVERCKQQGWMVREESFTLGVSAERAADAERGVFELLNSLSSYFQLDVARQEIDRYTEIRRARSAAEAELERLHA